MAGMARPTGLNKRKGTQMKSYSQISLAVLLLALSLSAAGCSSNQITKSHQEPITTVNNVTPGIPAIPASAIPRTGSVIEYWPHGQVKSEREYIDGKMVSGVYYTSNGQVIYEMAVRQSKDEKVASDTR